MVWVTSGESTSGRSCWVIIDRLHLDVIWLSVLKTRIHNHSSLERLLTTVSVGYYSTCVIFLVLLVLTCASLLLAVILRDIITKSAITTLPHRTCLPPHPTHWIIVDRLWTFLSADPDHYPLHGLPPHVES